MGNESNRESIRHPVQFEFCGQGYSLTIDEGESLLSRVRYAVERARKIVCMTCQSSDGVSAECCRDDTGGKCPAPGERCPYCPACGAQEVASNETR